MKVPCCFIGCFYPPGITIPFLFLAPLPLSSLPTTIVAVISHLTLAIVVDFESLAAAEGLVTAPAEIEKQMSPDIRRRCVLLAFLMGQVPYPTPTVSIRSNV